MTLHTFGLPDLLIGRWRDPPALPEAIARARQARSDDLTGAIEAARDVIELVDGVPYRVIEPLCVGDEVRELVARTLDLACRDLRLEPRPEVVWYAHEDTVAEMGLLHRARGRIKRQGRAHGFTYGYGDVYINAEFQSWRQLMRTTVHECVHMAEPFRTEDEVDARAEALARRYWDEGELERPAGVLG